MSDDLIPPDDIRLILVHKQRTSARVRFVCLSHGIWAFSPIPEGVTLADPSEIPKIRWHPAIGVRIAAAHLRLDPTQMSTDPHALALLEGKNGHRITILLVQFSTIDPPFSEVSAIGGRFISLTEARSCSPLEQQLLGRAWSQLME
ncbi:MAG: hypothetical protein N2557_06890 [Hydrogenophilus sp.]|nr:hypothetical protein [Hydrogenophilus sp.]